MESVKPLTYSGRQVDALFGGSKSSRHARQDPKSPQFDPTWPVPIKLSARRTAYLVHEVEAWLASRPRVRDISQHEAPEMQARQMATRCGCETVQKTQQQTGNHGKARACSGMAAHAAKE